MDWALEAIAAVIFAAAFAGLAIALSAHLLLGRTRASGTRRLGRRHKSNRDDIREAIDQLDRTQTRHGRSQYWEE